MMTWTIRAALLLLAAPALAQATHRPTAAEAASLEACLREGAGAGARRACIGRVAEPCRADASAEACWSRERALWVAVLDRAFTARLTASGEDERVRLNDTQRAWLAYLDLACDRPAGATECQATQTALRAVDLMGADAP